MSRSHSVCWVGAVTNHVNQFVSKNHKETISGLQRKSRCKAQELKRSRILVQMHSISAQNIPFEGEKRVFVSEQAIFS